MEWEWGLSPNRSSGVGHSLYWENVVEWEWGLSPDRSSGVGHRVESHVQERSLTGSLTEAPSHMTTKEDNMVGKMIG